MRRITFCFAILVALTAPAAALAGRPALTKDDHALIA